MTVGDFSEFVDSGLKARARCSSILLSDPWIPVQLTVKNVGGIKIDELMIPSSRSVSISPTARSSLGSDPFPFSLFYDPNGLNKMFKTLV